MANNIEALVNSLKAKVEVMEKDILSVRKQNQNLKEVNDGLIKRINKIENKIS